MKNRLYKLVLILNIIGVVFSIWLTQPILSVPFNFAYVFSTVLSVLFILLFIGLVSARVIAAKYKDGDIIQQQKTLKKASFILNIGLISPILWFIITLLLNFVDVFSRNLSHWFFLAGPWIFWGGHFWGFYDRISTFRRDAVLSFSFIGILISSFIVVSTPWGGPVLVGESEIVWVIVVLAILFLGIFLRRKLGKEFYLTQDKAESLSSKAPRLVTTHKFYTVTLSIMTLFTAYSVVMETFSGSKNPFPFLFSFTMLLGLVLSTGVFFAQWDKPKPTFPNWYNQTIKVLWILFYVIFVVLIIQKLLEGCSYTFGAITGTYL